MNDQWEKDRESEAAVMEALGYQISWRENKRNPETLIAWMRHADPDSRGGRSHYRKVPLVLASLNDAYWFVVRGMEMRGYHMKLTTPFEPGQPYFAGFTPRGTTGFNGRPDFQSSAETPAQAICDAALKTLKAEAKRRRKSGAGETPE